MALEVRTTWHEYLGRLISIGILIGALILGITILERSRFYPRTDDAEVLANFIGIAPQVEGPILHLNVHDNQFVKQGDLLFEIDRRPYEYALERALSDQDALEGQIADERRKIAALKSAVSVSKANIQSSQADLTRWEASIDQAKADVENAEQGVNRVKADWTYASNNLQRIEPLLVKQFVTVDQVDKARSSETALSEALKQTQSQVELARAGLKSALAQYQHSQAILEQSRAQHEQAMNAVTTLEPLVTQRGARASVVKNARYNLNNCRVLAPFDARVTNLTISEGAYAHVGQQVFTLIDARTWWVVANFREGQLQHVQPGMKADVYVMSKTNMRFSGIVDSIGFGVTPDADLVGRLEPGLPDVQRTLNWVHLSSRYPVRVRVMDPVPELFRVSESAVVNQVLFEFGPSRERNLALRDQIRRWQPQLRVLFILHISTWNYRARLPGFDLPDPLHSAQREFDEEFARILEGMANWLEGKPAEAPDNFNNSLQHLEQSVEIYAATESQTTLATGLRTYLARNRRIRSVTCALLQEI